MALEISYSPQFFDNLEGILKYFDERNGSDSFSKKIAEDDSQADKACLCHARDWSSYGLSWCKDIVCGTFRHRLSDKGQCASDY